MGDWIVHYWSLLYAGCLFLLVGGVAWLTRGSEEQQRQIIECNEREFEERMSEKGSREEYYRFPSIS